MKPSWLRPIILAALALGAAFGGGWCSAAARHTAQSRLELERAGRTSDSLRVELRSKVAAVVHDTAWRDSIVTRWRAARVETLPPVIIERAGHVDTVRLPAGAPLLQLADQTIAGLEDINRRCVSVLLDCERTAVALTSRAERAEASLAIREKRDQRAARWRSTERGVCLASLATNLVQWSLSR